MSELMTNVVLGGLNGVLVSALGVNIIDQPIRCIVALVCLSIIEGLLRK